MCKSGSESLFYFTLTGMRPEKETEMSRKYLFRGIQKTTGQYIYGDLLHWNNHAAIIPFATQSALASVEQLMVHPATVAQYTGLHDITKWADVTTAERLVWLESTYIDTEGETRDNTPETWCGREIFEGHIVKWGHLPNSHENPIRIAVVEFNPDIQYRTVTMKDPITGRDYFFKQGCFAYADTQYYLEIIGDTYHNKNLLEVPA